MCDSEINCDTNNDVRIRHYVNNEEANRWNEITSILKQKKVKLQIFFHTSTWQIHWKKVIEEQMLLLAGYRTEFPLGAQHPHGGPFEGKARAMEGLFANKS